MQEVRRVDGLQEWVWHRSDMRDCREGRSPVRA